MCLIKRQLFSCVSVIFYRSDGPLFGFLSLDRTSVSLQVVRFLWVTLHAKSWEPIAHVQQISKKDSKRTSHLNGSLSNFQRIRQNLGFGFKGVCRVPFERSFKTPIFPETLCIYSIPCFISKFKSRLYHGRKTVDFHDCRI